MKSPYHIYIRDKHAGGKIWWIQNTAAGRITAVLLLGHEGKLDWAQTVEGMFVTLPMKKPREYVFALKIFGDHLQPATVAK